MKDGEDVSSDKATRSSRCHDSSLRTKAAMVVFALEQSLADFVVAREDDPDNLPAGVLLDIEQRMISSPERRGPRTVQSALEDAYLNEVFSFAASVSRETSSLRWLTQLRGLCDFLDLYKIRNAIAHPNRPFPECYWHRVACIATDPLVELLGLHGVISAFRQAVLGHIQDPPADWLTSQPSLLPHNLPSTFEHEITGLVGREREAKDIKKYLLNPRVATLAIVAPGGVGKTALVLDLMRELCQSPEAPEAFDAVCFVSAKTERLTVKGIENLTAAETIEDVQKRIAHTLGGFWDEDASPTFDGIRSKYGAKRALIVLDNLETLIRDKHECFSSFLLELPPSWRILATSRVTVDSATTMSLPVLTRQAAEHLVTTYASRSGAGKLDRSSVTMIADACGHNPLAIRLTVDLYGLGKELPVSLKMVKKDVTDFSFANLIDAISDTSVGVLECLFALQTAARSDLSDILGVSLDSMAEAVAELSRTSLVVRTVVGESESYSLNSSVVDLVLTNSRGLAVRDQIANTINKRKQIERQIVSKQSEAGVSRWERTFIPHDVSQAFKILFEKTIRALSKRMADSALLSELQRDYRIATAEHPASAPLRRFYGLLLVRLRDKRGWEQEFRKAIELLPADPVAAACLGRAYHDNKDFQDAETVFASLWQDQWQDPVKSDVAFASIVANGYFFALLYQGKHQIILDLTKGWKEKEALRATWGAFRAAAWKREVEQYDLRQPEKVVAGLHSAIQIIDDIIRNNGYSDTLAREAFKIIEEIEYRLGNVNHLAYAEGIAEWLAFVDRHLRAVTAENAQGNVQRSKIVRSLRRLELEGNPFRSARWAGLEEGAVADRSSVARDPDGYIKAKIYSIPERSAFRYLFARSAKGDEYYVTAGSLENGDLHDWWQLRVGDELHLRPASAHRQPGKAIPTASARLVIQ